MSYWDWLYGRGPLREPTPLRPRPNAQDDPGATIDRGAATRVSPWPGASNAPGRELDPQEHVGEQPPGVALAKMLGLVGNQLPGTFGSQVPVALMADYSGRLNPEALEPRTIVSEVQGSTLALPWLFLQSQTPGGFIVETLKLTATVSGVVNPRVVVWRRSTLPAFVGALPFVGTLANFGGLPTTTRFRRSDTGATGFGDAQLIAPLELTDVRVWVPPGWFLGFSLVDANGILLVQATLRELLDVQPGASFRP